MQGQRPTALYNASQVHLVHSMHTIEFDYIYRIKLSSYTNSYSFKVNLEDEMSKKSNDFGFLT